MTDRYRTADGWSVEIVQLTGTPDHHDGTWLRVCYFGSYVADVRTPEELVRYFPLDELEPSLTGRMPRASYSYQFSVPSPRRSWTSQVILTRLILCTNGSASLCQASTVTGTQVWSVRSTSAGRASLAGKDRLAPGARARA